MNNQTEIESRIRERLNEIKGVPPRNPQAAARGRARFLTQAVSAREAQRQTGWRPIFRMRQFALNMAVTLAVIVGLLVGGGTTVKAAQNNLPGEPLYAIKTFSEDVGLQFQSNPEARVDRLMQLAQTRVDEMSRLVATGRTPPEQVSRRLQQHLSQALQLCSSMDDSALDQKLPQLHTELQKQEQELRQLQAHAAQGSESILEQTNAMLAAQLNVVDTGLQNHQAFRETVNNGMHYGQTQTAPVAVPSPISTPALGDNSQPTTPPGNPGNGNPGNGVGLTDNPGQSQTHVVPTPRNDHPTPVNNAGGNDNNKDKDKDKDKGKPGGGGKPNK